LRQLQSKANWALAWASSAQEHLQTQPPPSQLEDTWLCVKSPAPARESIGIKNNAIENSHIFLALLKEEFYLQNLLKYMIAIDL
jgi:hypothetical protein